LKKDINKIINQLVEDHKWLEKTAMKYLEETKVYYVDNKVEYEKYIIPFLRILEEELLMPHFKFEEETIFPLLHGDPLIDELGDEHRDVKDLLNKFRTSQGGIEVLEELLHLLDRHVKKEDEKLSSKLHELTKKSDFLQNNTIS
jgi:hypothetical protein